MRAVCLWVLLCMFGTARAQQLAWQAPASCPDLDEVQQRIDQRLGAVGAVPGVTVEIEIRRGGYVARIDLRALTVENDVRELRAARCDELVDAVAIVLARVAAEVAERRDPPPPAVAAAPGLAASPGMTVAVPDPLPGKADAVPWRAGARVLGLSGIGAMPEVSVGGELAMFVRGRTMFVEAAGARWFPENAVLRHGAPGAVAIDLTLAALRLGWSSVDVPVRTWLGTEVGSMSGSGVALGRNDIGSARWIAASGGVGVAWRMLPWLQLVGSIELAVPFTRPRFVLLDHFEVFRPEAVTVRSGLGLEVSM